jgi:hypothetical protein
MTIAGALAGAVLLGCNNGVTDPHEAELTVLRDATQNLTSLQAAAAAGYGTQITDCMTDPVQGGMGFHIGNPDYINATLELDKPEVLLFEPTAGGGRQLVAVEYLIPFAAWTSANPPVLMGQNLKRNEQFQVWALHVWLYKDNPAGIFADWNSQVSCAAAPASMGGPAPMTHGPVSRPNGARF